MKTFVKRSLTIIIALIFIQLTLNAQKKTDIRVVKLQTSAHTEMCKAKIEKTLAYEKGIVESELDRESQIMTVTYKAEKTNVKKIIKIITSLGHDAMEITEKAAQKEGPKRNEDIE